MKKYVIPSFLGACFLPTLAMAADGESKLNGADIAYMAVATLLVLIMTPALAFFYGGLVRRKNTINTIMMSMVCLAIFTVQWFVYGYSISFGPDVGGIIGRRGSHHRLTLRRRARAAAYRPYCRGSRAPWHTRR